MSHSLALLALLVVQVFACAALAEEARRPPCSGYLADVEVCLGGVTRHGRIIVSHDGCVSLEHLDDQALRWANDILRHESSPSKGWNDRPLRAGPVQRVWGRLGQHGVLTAIHTLDGSLKISRHRLLSDR